MKITLKNISLLSLARKFAFLFLVFIIPAGLWTLLLLGFWPGKMSYDSFVQWNQVMTFKFFDWHPFFHTLLMWMITRLWNSPGAVAFTQVLSFSAAVAYSLKVFKDNNVPKMVLIGICIIFSGFLLNGIMAITLWKDIAYSISVLLITTYILRIITSQAVWIDKPLHWALFGFANALVALFRHNGLPVSVAMLLVLALAYRNRWRQFAAAAAVFLAFFLFIKVPVSRWLNVDTTRTQGPGVIFIHPIAAHVNADTTFSAEDRAFIDKIYPLQNEWTYSCYDATVLFYKGVNFTPVIEEPVHAAEILLRATLKSPLVTLKHYACVSSFLWMIPQPDQVYLEPFFVEDNDARIVPGYEGYYYTTRIRSKLPAVYRTADYWFDSMMDMDTRKILSRPAIYTYLLVISVVITCIRQKNWAFLLLLLPVFVHSIILAVSIQLQAVRYQYPIYVVSMLFSIPLLFLPEHGKTKELASTQEAAG